MSSQNSRLSEANSPDLESSPHITVGSFQAKTYFADLIRKVESGVVVTITRNGHDVAVMQSPQSARNSKALKAWSKLMNLSRHISVNGKNNGSPISKAENMEWKSNGHK